MKKRMATAAVLALATVAQGVEARTLEDVLKEKGVITEEDYKEVTRVKPVKYIPGKGFTFSSDDEKFRLSLGGRLQARYSYTDLENNSTVPDTNKWEVRRMKFWMNGNAYTKDLTYLLQVDFANSGKPQMFEHGYLNYRLRDEVQLLAGQTKVPFGRQWLNSSGSQEFIDRSSASDAFRPGYDSGVKLHGDILKGVFAYDLGVYGGAGQSTSRSSSTSAVAARLAVNPFGKMAYSEADLENTSKPQLSIGANYYGNSLKKTAATTLETNSITLAGSNGWLGKGLATFNANEKVNIDTWGLDTAFKWLGGYVQAEYLAGQAEGADSGKLLRAQGAYVQTGYCIIPKVLEAAIRYSYVDPNRDNTNDILSETQGALSWYIDKHNLKLQGDVTNSHDKSKGKSDDMIYRLQAQVVF